MTLGRKEISVLLLAVGALLFFMVFLLSMSSEAQTGGDSTGAEQSVNQAQSTPAQSSGAVASAGQGGASAKSRRQKDKVIAKTVPKRPLPPTGGLPVYAMVAGFVLTGTGLLGAGLVVRRGRRR